MTEYVRPSIDDRVFTDGVGDPIPYGARWPDSPPDESCSVTAHPERFAPLQMIADALLAHLAGEYEVTEEQDHAIAARDGAEISRDTRAVRLAPKEGGAPLTFVFTDFPGVLLHVGASQRFSFPVCGCDACDDDVARLADDLERTVLDVVAGRLDEEVTGGDEPVVRFSLRDADGVSGTSGSGGLDVSGRDRPADLARDRPWTSSWTAWPTRTSGRP